MGFLRHNQIFDVMIEKSDYDIKNLAVGYDAEIPRTFGPNMDMWTGYYCMIGLDQGCPTFLFNGLYCKLKYLTGPQNH